MSYMRSPKVQVNRHYYKDNRNLQELVMCGMGIQLFGSGTLTAVTGGLCPVWWEVAEALTRVDAELVFSKFKRHLQGPKGDGRNPYTLINKRGCKARTRDIV